MSSPARTLIGGIIAIAVCILLSSLSWLQLLVVVGLSSVGWGLWSWLSALEKRRKLERMQRRARLELRPRTRRPRVRRVGNVYELPTSIWGADDLADWSGALE